MRDAQLKANDELVARSRGLLSPRSGTERLLTLGAGHTTAGIRASNHGCVTPIGSLSDGSGKINLSMQKSRSVELRAMHEKGWKAIVIKWTAVKQWGKLRDVGQQALNVVNNVGLPPTELEVARRLGSFSDECDHYNQRFKEEDAVAQATAEGPPCQRYAKSIATWVRAYGGGPGNPHSRFHRRRGYFLRRECHHRCGPVPECDQCSMGRS